jgi:preprotein translocase subunit Sss1
MKNTKLIEDKKMNEIIKRYIDDVIRRLPNKERTRVEDDLRNKIESHLNDEMSTHDLEQVLINMGHPKDVANQYRLKKRYLVSPEQFDDYVNVLKIVAIVILSLSVIGVFISIIVLLIMGSEIGLIGRHISSWIGRTFSILTFAFFIITIVFHLLDQEVVIKKRTTFSIEKLPKTKEKIDLKYAKKKAILSFILEVFLSVIFIILTINYIDYIGWYEDGDLLAKLFNYMYVMDFLPFIIIALAINLITSAIKLCFNYWNIFLGVIHTFSKGLGVIVVLFFLNFAGIFNHGFFIIMAQFANANIDVVMEGLEVAVLMVSLVIVLVLIANLMITWSNVFKKKRLHKA